MAEFEDIYDALKGAVAALGGAKKVGPKLRPESRDARGWLLNCLNPEHAQKMDPEQVQLLLRLACEVGYHDAKHWIDADAGYQPALPARLEARLAEALRENAETRRRLDESNRCLRELADNPRLLAWARTTGVKVEE